MELPPLTRHYFSPIPARERACRWLCFLTMVGLVAILYLYWSPLRSTEFAYSMVAITVENILVLVFFQVITVLGSEGFFLVLLSFIYWSLHKPLGFWGLMVMPLSIFVTSEIPKDIIKLPRPEVRGVTVPTYTFPSGHTSGAVSVWGFLAVIMKIRWFWVWAIFIMVMVGLSRIMLGYHFPGDVLGGIVTGTAFLALFFGLIVKVQEQTWKWKPPWGISLLLVGGVPLALSFVPASYAPNLMGYMAGAGMGYLLERKYINFSVAGRRSQHLARTLLGLSVIALIIPGLDLLLNFNFHLLVFLQHAFSTFWTTFLAPWTFVKLKLASTQ